MKIIIQCNGVNRISASFDNMKSIIINKTGIIVITDKVDETILKDKIGQEIIRVNE